MEKAAGKPFMNHKDTFEEVDVQFEMAEEIESEKAIDLQTGR